MTSPTIRLPRGWRRLPRRFYARDSRDVAPELLNKVLVRADPEAGLLAGRIVEAEAYCGQIDPGSHAFRGRTNRNATMFGPAGGLYVYFTYGMHWCANAVCAEEGVAYAVLLRALAPVAGIEAMHARRGPAAIRVTDLCSGPAKLCQALGLTGDADGADLVRADRAITIADDGVAPPAEPVQTTRVGVTDGAEHPWRWYVPGDPNVSRWR